MRLKNWFGKLSKSSRGVHEISDTPENAHDLEVFLERFPMEVSASDRDRLKRNADRHKEQASLVDAMLSKRTEAPAFDLAIPARDYQRVAAHVALETGGLLLADEVGLGKTASAICTFTDPRTLPALVVTLTHLPRQWEAEIKRFAPHLTTHILKKGTPYDFTRPGAHRNGNGDNGQLVFGFAERMPDVIITNYHKLSGWSDTLSPLIRSVVYDEVQELRIPDSLKYSAAQQISESAKFRIGLSATPIYNYGGEFFNVLDCIRPGGLGARDEFLREWCTDTWGEQRKVKIADPKAFGSYLRESGLMIRRTREDVGRELPELTKVVHHIEANISALDKVSRSCAELARLILAQGEQFKGQKMQASEELSNKLRQATGVAKSPYVAEFVQLLVESGERVLLYGWHREVYSIWRDIFTSAGLNPVMFTGSETPVAKERAKRAFLKGDAKVLMMSLRAGAGVDGLQGVGSTVVFGELDWSPGVMDQCIGRVHRDGQDRKVIAYFLMSDHGSDPIVADVLGLKRAQMTGVRDPNASLVERLESSGDHMKRLAESYLSQVEKGRVRNGTREVSTASVRRSEAEQDSAAFREDLR